MQILIIVFPDIIKLSQQKRNGCLPETKHTDTYFQLETVVTECLLVIHVFVKPHSHLLSFVLQLVEKTSLPS